MVPLDFVGFSSSLLIPSLYHHRTIVIAIVIILHLLINEKGKFCSLMTVLDIIGEFSVKLDSPKPVSCFMFFDVLRFISFVENLKCSKDIVKRPFGNL